MLVSNGFNLAEMANICPLLLRVRVALSSRKGLSASGRLRNPIQPTTPKVLGQRVTQEPQKTPLMYRYPGLLCSSGYYSVSFSQSRIIVKNVSLPTTQSRFVKSHFVSVLRPTRTPVGCSCTCVVQRATYEARLRAFKKGPAQKDFQGSRIRSMD